MKGTPEALAAAIKPVYMAVSDEAAQAELDAFPQGAWRRKVPKVEDAWRRASHRENINARLRKIIKSRGYFTRISP